MSDAELEWVGGGPNNIWTASRNGWNATVLKSAIGRNWWWKLTRGDFLSFSDFKEFGDHAPTLEAAKAAVAEVIRAK